MKKKLSAKKKEKDYKKFAPTILRFVLGGYFLTTAIAKFISLDEITNFIGSYNLPGAYFFAWVWILVEFIFGAMVLTGWNVKYSVWPLVIVLSLIIVFVFLPVFSSSIIMIWFYLIAICALVSLYLTGPGAWAVGD